MQKQIDKLEKRIETLERDRLDSWKMIADLCDILKVRLKKKSNKFEPNHILESYIR